MRKVATIIGIGVGGLILACCLFWVFATRIYAGAGASLVEHISGARGRLAFVTDPVGPNSQTGLHLVNSDGSQGIDLPLTRPLSIDPASLTWSPDGTRLAFEMRNDSPGGSTWVVGADGSRLAQVTQAGGEPRWSPDGSELLVYHCCPDSPERYTLWRINADGSGLTKLAENAGSVAWSPDGTTIAISDPGERDRMWLLPTDGSARTLITDGITGNPIWAPNGTRIAFNTVTSGIYTVKPDGTQLTRVTNNSSWTALTWSPDSSRLLFTAMERDRPVIYIAAADGSFVKPLLRSWSRDGNPVWSPDGTQIAFASTPWSILGTVIGIDELDIGAIFVVNADGSGLRRLTPESLVVHGGPVWSPDGRLLAFTAERTDYRAKRGVFVVKVDGTAVAQLADEGEAPVWQPQP